MIRIDFSPRRDGFIHMIDGDNVGFGPLGNGVNRLLKLLHFRQARRAPAQMGREGLPELGVLVIGRIDPVRERIIINITGRDRFAWDFLLLYPTVRQRPTQFFAPKEQLLPAVGTRGQMFENFGVRVPENHRCHGRDGLAGL